MTIAFDSATPVTWASGANPAGQNVTVPSNCTHAVMFWNYFGNSTGAGLLSSTLDGNAPSLSGSWTSGGTQTNNSESARLSYITATGTTTVCDCNEEDYSGLACVSIAPASGGSTAVPVFMNHLRTQGIS